jgi:hypothetical protein
VDSGSPARSLRACLRASASGVAGVVPETYPLALAAPQDEPCPARLSYPNAEAVRAFIEVHALLELRNGYIGESDLAHI